MKNLLILLILITGINSFAVNITFKNLIDDLDYSSPSYQIKLRENLVPILNKERISFNELEMLLFLLNKINQEKPSFIFKLIEHELKQLFEFVKLNDADESIHFVLIFNKKIPLKQAHLIKTKLLQIPIDLYLNKLLIKSSTTRDLNLSKYKPKKMSPQNLNTDNKTEEEKTIRSFYTRESFFP